MNYKFILLIPFLEIICFILSGDYLGFFLVILLIFVTGFLGFILVKSNINLSDIEKLINEPNEWLYKKIAGILLIIPGFVTDLLGLILLVKSLRGMAWSILTKKKKPGHKSYNKNNHNTNENTENIIEVDYKDLDEK